MALAPARSIEGPAFIDVVRAAIHTGRTTTLAEALDRLFQDGAFDDAQLFAAARHDRYTRKLIYADPSDAFVIVAMTWSASQGSPLHDHNGLWGAELIVRGSMLETTFSLRGREGDRYFFDKRAQREASAGTVGIISPPYEHHEFGNATDSIAHTVHVYSGNLRQCAAFFQNEDGSHAARSVLLGYDASLPQ